MKAVGTPSCGDSLDLGPEVFRSELVPDSNSRPGSANAPTSFAANPAMLSSVRASTREEVQAGHFGEGGDCVTTSVSVPRSPSAERCGGDSGPVAVSFTTRLRQIEDRCGLLEVRLDEATSGIAAGLDRIVAWGERSAKALEAMRAYRTRYEDALQSTVGRVDELQESLRRSEEGALAAVARERLERDGAVERAGRALLALQSAKLADLERRLSGSVEVLLERAEREELLARPAAGIPLLGPSRPAKSFGAAQEPPDGSRNALDNRADTPPRRGHEPARVLPATPSHGSEAREASPSAVSPCTASPFPQAPVPRAQGLRQNDIQPLLGHHRL